nr:hypothetical protein [uncultured Merdimonas sp.]
MEDFKQELEQLFDEMIHQIRFFKKKTYSPAFLQAYDQHQELLTRVSAWCAEAEEEEISSLAQIIPEYAYQKMQKLSRRDKEKFALNFNLTMVAYVVPLFRYTRDPYCEKITEQMVSFWNQKKVTKMEIGMSDYEKISSGFKKSWFFKK